MAFFVGMDTNVLLPPAEFDADCRPLRQASPVFTALNMAGSVFDVAAAGLIGLPRHRREPHPLSWQTSPLADLPSRVLLIHHDGTAAPSDHERTVFPFERLQRVPDLHLVTFLPTCCSKRTDTRRYSGGRVAQLDCEGATPPDRATSARFASADPAFETDEMLG
jgi:hypothetical protein